MLVRRNEGTSTNESLHQILNYICDQLSLKERPAYAKQMQLRRNEDKHHFASEKNATV